MLGPVLLLLRLKRDAEHPAQISLAHLVPWFIVGFFAMMGLRSFDLIRRNSRLQRRSPPLS
ncbi:putative sulfate exporter family transporter [Rhizobium chutanense]